MTADPTERFSTRVENYIRYRPGYPETLPPLLEAHSSLVPGDVLVDLGSGTGKLTELLLKRGYAVYAIEPNGPMREAAARLIADPDCTMIDGTAEATGLPDACADVAVAAQAFHWFDLEPTRAELDRVLRPRGRVVAIWNVRDKENDPFMAEYEALLAEHGTNYRDVGAHGLGDVQRERLFGPDRGRLDRLANEQRLDLDGLIGRVLSASYSPEPGQAGHAPMVEALETLFGKYQCDGEVVLRYRTEVYHGTLYR